MNHDMLYQQKPGVRPLQSASARSSVLPGAHHSWTTGVISGPHILRGHRPTGANLEEETRTRRTYMPGCVVNDVNSLEKETYKGDRGGVSKFLKSYRTERGFVLFLII